MKKLTITTMALASLALCANAGTDAGFISGTTFNNYTDQSEAPLGVDQKDSDSASGVYWFSTSADGSYIVKNLGESYTLPEGVTRPANWADTTDKLALFIDTDKPLLRTINTYEGGLDGYTSSSFKDNDIYFDSLVQFTATWTPPTPDTEAGDKLIVWLYGSEGVSDEEAGLFGETTATTNLVITAGAYNSLGEDLGLKNFKVSGVTVKSDEWYRLTIKAGTRTTDDNVVIPCYQVYINGTLVEGTAGELTTQAFDSIVNWRNTKAFDIYSVGFEGTGAVDDLAFTTTNPFAVETVEFNVTLNDADGMSMGTVSYYYTDALLKELTLNDEGTGVLNIPVTEEKVTFKIEITEGYKLEDGDEAGVASEENGTKYWTKTVSRTDGSVELKVVEDTTGGDTEDTELPSIGDQEVTADELVGSATTASDNITLPTLAEGEWTVAGNVLKKNGEVFATFADYYTLTITDGKLGLALNDTVKPVIQATEEKEAITFDGDTITINVSNTNNNLYYGVEVFTTLGGKGNIIWGKVKGQVPSVTKPGTCGFFKIVVSD